MPIHFNESRFEGNNVLGGGGGVAILVVTNPSVIFTGCNFTNNGANEEVRAGEGDCQGGQVGGSGGEVDPIGLGTGLTVPA